MATSNKSHRLRQCRLTYFVRKEAGYLVAVLDVGTIFEVKFQRDRAHQNMYF